MTQFKHNPCDSTRITSSFGYRKNPITKQKQFHKGIDIGKKSTYHEPIYSVDDGYIAYQGYTKQCGNYVVIQHSGYATKYQHLDQYIIKIGQDVHAGQIIGSMGSTGASTGVHLHFEYHPGKYNSSRVENPISYLRR